MGTRHILTANPEPDYHGGREYGDGERFRRLALYFAHRSADDGYWGMTKLAKLLFYSDFQAYGELDASITGATYTRYPHGPYPVALKDEVDAIVKREEGYVEPVRRYGYEQRRLRPRGTSVDTSLFTDPEIAIAEKMLERLSVKSAAEVEEEAHEEPACLLVKDGEPIPYELCFASLREPTPEEIRIGQDVARRLEAAMPH